MTNAQFANATPTLDTRKWHASDTGCDVKHKTNLTLDACSTKKGSST